MQFVARAGHRLRDKLVSSLSARMPTVCNIFETVAAAIEPSVARVMSTVSCKMFCRRADIFAMATGYGINVLLNS